MIRSKSEIVYEKNIACECIIKNQSINSFVLHRYALLIIKNDGSDLAKLICLFVFYRSLISA